MKAVTINISLNPDLADFARADADAGAFDSMSEYMRDLIRQRREAKIAEDAPMPVRHRVVAEWGPTKKAL